MKNLRASLAIGLATGLLVLPLGLRTASAEDEPMDRTTERGTDADNTERNERDRDGMTLTPMDQGGSEADRTITQEIRKSVMAHDALSMNAKNTKIITQDGVVTLRGPVKSAEERAQVAAMAAKTPGVKRVDNQLEIEAGR